jgi:hypothetical protein
MRQKLETAIRPREAFPRRALAFLMALAAVLTAAFAFRGLVEPTGVAAATAAARALVAAHPLFSALGFALLYTAIAALAVPVIWVMNVAAGALFGPWIGLPIAVASSVTGATITMLAARYALRGWVKARFPAAIARFDEGAASGARGSCSRPGLPLSSPFRSSIWRQASPRFGRRPSPSSRSWACCRSRSPMSPQGPNWPQSKAPPGRFRPGS